MIIKFIPLHRNLIEDFFATIELDNSASADYLKYEKLIVKSDDKDTIIFDIEDSYNPICITDYKLSDECYYNGAIIYNTESHSIEFFNDDQFSILQDFLYKYAEMIELCEFELIVED